MAYGTSEITTYGIFKMTYGVILAWLNGKRQGKDEHRTSGSPYKAMQVRKYRSVLLCKHLIFRYVLIATMICSYLKSLTHTVL